MRTAAWIAALAMTLSLPVRADSVSDMYRHTDSMISFDSGYTKGVVDGTAVDCSVFNLPHKAVRHKTIRMETLVRYTLAEFKHSATKETRGIMKFSSEGDRTYGRFYAYDMAKGGAERGNVLMWIVDGAGNVKKWGLSEMALPNACAGVMGDLY